MVFNKPYYTLLHLVNFKVHSRLLPLSKPIKPIKIINTLKYKNELFN